MDPNVLSAILLLDLSYTSSTTILHDTCTTGNYMLIQLITEIMLHYVLRKWFLYEISILLGLTVVYALSVVCLQVFVKLSFILYMQCMHTLNKRGHK